MNNKFIEEEPNIYYVTENHSTTDYVFKKGEWYFGDESEGINGPFLTKEECIFAFVEYCRGLD